MELANVAKGKIANLVEHHCHNPTYVYRPQCVRNSIQLFKNHLPAKLLYAVKTNPEAFILNQVAHSGITNFDVASIEEIEAVRASVDKPNLFYMHPVKPRHAITSAYFDYGIRDFAFDTEYELEKIKSCTAHAKDLRLHLRIALNHTHSKIDLSTKFGASLEIVPKLLKKASLIASQLGVSFHVGSQCMEPLSYYNSILTIHHLLKRTPVAISYFNIGGGFPSLYSNMTPPPLTAYFDKINQALSELPSNYEILAEPGRALVAESMSLIVRVDLRKGDILYINDGIYGGLFDAGSLNFHFPIKRISSKQPRDIKLMPFSFYGPTCDSIDYMPGPFWLPHNVKEGDFIEIGQLGAYSATLASKFNGFSHNPVVYEVSDSPILTMYSPQPNHASSFNHQAA